MRIFSGLILSLSIALAAAAACDAQMAILSGTLTDPTGAVITGAQVKATGKDRKEFRADTNSLGVYAFELPVAAYRIEFKVSGCESFVIPEYVISDEKRPVLDAEIPEKNCKAGDENAPAGAAPVSAPATYTNLPVEISSRQPLDMPPFPGKRSRNRTN